MQILLNDNFLSQHSLIVNTGVPTILSISADTSGSTAYMVMTLAAGIDATQDYYLTINGHSVYSTTSEADSRNNLFWVTPATSYATLKAMAYHLVKALRSTPLAIDYNIYINESAVSTTEVQIKIIAKNAGSQYSLTVDTNLPYSYNMRRGSSAEEMVGAKISVDIYANSGDTQNSLSNTDFPTPSVNLPYLKYVTALEKTVANEQVRFDLSNVLAMVTPTDNTAEWQFVVNATHNGNTRKIFSSPVLFAINGYQVNFGRDYFTYKPTETKDILLQNVSQGTQSEYLNATKLYYYPAEMFFVSVLSHSRDAMDVEINYLDAAKDVVSSTTESFLSNNNIYNIVITPVEVVNAKYMTITIPNLGTLIYDNITPTKYANTIQTVYWRNSYGGISHFTFAGKRTETREIEKTTYSSSNLDYYYPIKRYARVLDVSDDFTINQSSHYCHIDAKYSLYDLLKAKEVWIIENDKRYDIIVDSVAINDIQRDVIQAEIIYKYSSKHI